MEEEKSSNLTLNVCIWPIISVLSSKETIQCTPFFSHAYTYCRDTAEIMSQ
jgi:hypothetical protein